MCCVCDTWAPNGFIAREASFRRGRNEISQKVGPASLYQNCLSYENVCLWNRLRYFEIIIIIIIIIIMLLLLLLPPPPLS
jgi:hypothetical protein